MIMPIGISSYTPSLVTSFCSALRLRTVSLLTAESPDVHEGDDMVDAMACRFSSAMLVIRLTDPFTVILPPGMGAYTCPSIPPRMIARHIDRTPETTCTRSEIHMIEAPSAVRCSVCAVTDSYSTASLPLASMKSVGYDPGFRQRPPFVCDHSGVRARTSLGPSTLAPSCCADRQCHRQVMLLNDRILSTQYDKCNINVTATHSLCRGQSRQRPHEPG